MNPAPPLSLGARFTVVCRNGLGFFWFRGLHGQVLDLQTIIIVAPFTAVEDRLRDLFDVQVWELVKDREIWNETAMFTVPDDMDQGPI